MSKHRDEAAYLQSQADRLEEFIDFSKPHAAVFPNLKPSKSQATSSMPSRPLDELEREPNGRDTKE